MPRQTQGFEEANAATRDPDPQFPVEPSARQEELRSGGCTDFGKEASVSATAAKSFLVFLFELKIQILGV